MNRALVIAFGEAVGVVAFVRPGLEHAGEIKSTASSKKFIVGPNIGMA